MKRAQRRPRNRRPRWVVQWRNFNSLVAALSASCRSASLPMPCVTLPCPPYLARCRCLLLGSQEELYLPPAWALHGINAVMVGSACVAMAITKQLVLPRSAFRVPEVYASMPAWYTERYRAALVWRGALKQVLRDSATLMASCAAWWGLEVRGACLRFPPICCALVIDVMLLVTGATSLTNAVAYNLSGEFISLFLPQTVLDKVRPADDHINGYVGGMVGGAIVGQRFFPPAPHAAMRTFACAAIGGLSGARCKAVAGCALQQQVA